MFSLRGKTEGGGRFNVWAHFWTQKGTANGREEKDINKIYE